MANHRRWEGSRLFRHATQMERGSSSMKGWSTSRFRGLLAIGVAAACTVGIAGPASADLDPDANDWGTIVPNAGCVQADSWIARVEGVGGAVNTALFESHFPTMPKAPDHQGGGGELVNLTVGGVGLGKISALSTRALGNSVPIDPMYSQSATKPESCAA